MGLPPSDGDLRDSEGETLDPASLTGVDEGGLGGVGEVSLLIHTPPHPRILSMEKLVCKAGCEPKVAGGLLVSGVTSLLGGCCFGAISECPADEGNCPGRGCTVEGVGAENPKVG